MPEVRELFDRDATIEAGGKGNEGITRRYQRRFQVRTDAWHHSPLKAAFETGLTPRIGDIYESGGSRDAGARCHRINPVGDPDEPRKWVISYEYSTDENDIGDLAKEDPSGTGGEPGNNSGEGQGNQEGSGSQGPDNPLNRPPEIVYETEEGTRIAFTGYDLNGDAEIPVRVALTMSSGESVDPPVEMPDAVGVLTITKNLATYSPAWTEQYVNHINSVEWFGFGAGKVRCVGIPGRSVTENGQTYWVVVFRFKIRREGWDIEFKDQGFYQIVGGQKQKILDFGGGQLAAPWPLDGAGEELTPADVLAGNFFYRRYRYFEYADFNALRLP